MVSFPGGTYPSKHSHAHQLIRIPVHNKIFLPLQTLPTHNWHIQYLCNKTINSKDITILGLNVWPWRSSPMYTSLLGWDSRFKSDMTPSMDSVKSFLSLQIRSNMLSYFLIVNILHPNYQLLNIMTFGLSLHSLTSLPSFHSVATVLIDTHNNCRHGHPAWLSQLAETCLYQHLQKLAPSPLF